MSYPSVSIGSTPYNVYADIETADLYQDASIASQGTAWRASTATDVVKGRALVSATRWLDSVLWSGDKTDADQELQWPRSNITDVPSDELPAALVSACIELAGYLVEDPDTRSSLNNPVTKRQAAGSVSLEVFRPDNVQVATPFPASVMAYISQWLAGYAATAGAESFGTGRKNRLLRDDFDFIRGL